MREVRPLNIAYLCALAGFFLPGLLVFREIPPAYFFFCGLLGLAALFRERRELSLRIQALLALPALAYTVLRLSVETLIPVLSGFLLVLQTAKFLGPRTPRDLLQSFLLNTLLLVGAALLRFDLLYAGVFFLEVLLTVSGLFFLFASRESSRLPEPSAKALALASFGASVAVLFFSGFYFLVLPRARFTLFSLARGRGLTGVSDRVAPGEISALKEDQAVAFRVRWLRGRRPQRPYFRIYVYNVYRQGVWESRLPRRKRGRNEPADFEVEVLPEALGRGLPVPGYALEVATLKGPQAEVLSEGLVRTREEVLEPSLYRLKGRLGPYPADLPPEEFLYVPPEIRRALVGLALRLRRTSLPETVAAAVAYLQKHYTYTLSPGKPRGEPLLWFLFSSRKGHCEYFAGALTFLLRTLGIPARVVGGYAGGEWNPLGGYYLLRQNQAHTWVEYFDPARGWLSVDPTPASGGIQVPPSRWRLLWDYLEFKWYYWVLEYDFLKQRRLFLKVGRGLEGLPRSAWHPHLWPQAALLLVLPLLGILLWRRPRPRSPVEEFLCLFERRGLARLPGETLKTYAERLCRIFPHLSQEISRFVELYYREAYGQEKTRKAQQELLENLRARLDIEVSQGLKSFKKKRPFKL
ncbi:DUF3488 domain-containing protein [Thermosulfurimonas marina]|uniref:DUF3488 domain-containing protein n=1 Tax=Thermosulfurimonas marina TaxID=2047767 RepID=A0A6H1WU88_9BACT|nr:DUF3488 and transglutaminase-like domain-containing protein [Thermosulfurimonas marina]QJA06773.1 DUF3488 domain-containing protein [Thermosulfurimonas marina]